MGTGVQLGPLGTAANNRPIAPAPDDYKKKYSVVLFRKRTLPTERPPLDDGEIGGMMIDRKNRSTRRKPAPVPLYLPQTSYAARTRTRSAAVGSQRLTA
jgi:hypothetical protein